MLRCGVTLWLADITVWPAGVSCRGVVRRCVMSGCGQRVCYGQDVCDVRVWRVVVWSAGVSCCGLVRCEMSGCGQWVCHVAVWSGV
ncbi:hypothetical protein FKM82_010007 [Ascaphus truei]